MIKTVAKILFTLLFIIMTIYFYKQDAEDRSWNGYNPIIFNSEDDLELGLKILNEAVSEEILSKSTVEIGINNYYEIEEMDLESIHNNLDTKDYRYDYFIDTVNILFKSENNSPVAYVKMDSNFSEIYNMYKSLSESAISYKLGNPVFLRTILNCIGIVMLLIIFSIGCRTRLIISVFSAILIFFFMDPSSLYSFLSFSIGYFLIIMIVESISFSNKYIKRNNIGIIRVLIFISLFAMPTILPGFLDYSDKIYTPVSSEPMGYTYSSLETMYDKDSPNISNYFTHYAFQKSFLYGDEYVFPTYKNSVTIDEFNIEDYYLSSYVKVVHEYNDEFLNEFLLYSRTTVLGRFYLNYGRPFKLELNSLLSLYILKDEYKKVGILAFLVLISALFFKKNRDKKLKY